MTTAAMPVRLKGAFTVEADRPTVWARLHDPVFLRGCLRECEALSRIDETGYRGAARVRLGPFQTTFRAHIHLQDVDPLRGWRMIVSGAGGLAGPAKGVALVKLSDVRQGTSVAYTLEANFGNRITRLGNRLVEAAAQRVADRFFANLSAAIMAAES